MMIPDRWRLGFCSWPEENKEKTVDTLHCNIHIAEDIEVLMMECKKSR